MKKRKELDALLTMANGKKNGKGSKRSREGHELLRLDSDSNSSDNDELFLTPKKTVVRRPRPCQCCSMCVPLIMFILTMGCMVVTGGLIWMHFNLKQDLDDLRIQLDKVTVQANSASSQQNTIMDIESRLQKISDVPGKVDIASNNIESLNVSFRGSADDLSRRLAEVEKLKGRIESLEGKAPSTSAAELEQTVADFGNKINELEGKTDEHQSSIAAQNLVLEKIRDDLSTLQTQVADLQRTPAPPPTTPIPPPPQPQPSTTKSATTLQGSSGAGDGSHYIDAAGEFPQIWNAIHDVNSTVEMLRSEHRDLALSVAALQQSVENKTALPTPTSSHNVTPSQYVRLGQYNFTQMKADIELLKLECNRSAETVPTAVIVPQDTGSMNDTWLQLMTDRVDRIEERVDELDPRDLNNNLLNANTTQGIQFLLERSLDTFKRDNMADVTGLQGDVAGLRTDVDSQKTLQEEVGVRIASLGDQILGLQQDCAACTQAGHQTNPMQPSTQSSTSIPRSPTDTSTKQETHITGNPENPLNH